MATNENTKQYLVNGGELFTINFIDTIRDGGTKSIKTTNGFYYINKERKTFHSDYPTSDENLILDSLSIAYLIERIESYIEKCNNDLQRNKNMLTEIKQ
tara:strand:+ start:230 stop:526 length:297 start_codon:yes stop_codon:yes gene_type:complete